MIGKNKSVLVSGTFNVLHPGHVRLFRFAKELGQELIVAVDSERLAGDRSYVADSLRLEAVAAVQWVDRAFVNDKPLDELINEIRPDVVVKGKEHESLENIEEEPLSRYGGKLIFASGEVTFSSSNLLREEFKSQIADPLVLPEQFMTRHKISLSRLKEIVVEFSRLSVCVVGDLIVDEYIECQALGMSQEEPALVVSPLDSKRYIGGAGVVAGHARAMGANVKFITVAGDDDLANYVHDELNRLGVNAEVLRDESRPTTLKQRFRSAGRSLLRVSHLHQRSISSQLQTRFLSEVEKGIADADLLIFSDFNYGCLPQGLVQYISSICRERGVPIVADSQSSSQVGDVSRFLDMNLITPTEHEARIATRDQDSGLVVLAESLRQKSRARNIFLKLGGDGMLVYKSNNSGNPETDKIEALNRFPNDVAGAGDSLLVASSLALASGADVWEAACLGSLVAGIQVGRIGNEPIGAAEIVDVFQSLT